MDLSHPQSILSLGFSSSHASPPCHPPIPDESITLQLESSLRDPSHPLPPVPLQLPEPQTTTDNGNHDSEFNDADDDEDDREVEEFHILGHSMCLKRQRDCDSSSSSSISSSNRVSVSHESDLEARRASVRSWGNQSLQLADPDVFDIMEKEKRRQYRGIELIASENFVCKAVMDVQPYSCTSANFAVYTGLLLPGDHIMELDTPSGGNTSHGYYTPNGKKVSGASIFFESLPYKVNPQTGYVDYEKLEERALDFRPNMTRIM